MSANLDPQDRADLARFLREAIEADRFPLSPRVRRLKELLAKIDPHARTGRDAVPGAKADRRAKPGAGEARKTTLNAALDPRLPTSG